MKRLLLLLFIVGWIGCKDKCDGLSEVKIHVKPKGAGFDLYKIDNCGNQVRHLEYLGGFDPDVVEDMMKDVPKEIPINITY